MASRRSQSSRTNFNAQSQNSLPNEDYRESVTNNNPVLSHRRAYPNRTTTRQRQAVNRVDPNAEISRQTQRSINYDNVNTQRQVRINQSGNATNSVQADHTQRLHRIRERVARVATNLSDRASRGIMQNNESEAVRRQAHLENAQDRQQIQPNRRRYRIVQPQSILQLTQSMQSTTDNTAFEQEILAANISRLTNRITNLPRSRNLTHEERLNTSTQSTERHQSIRNNSPNSPRHRQNSVSSERAQRNALRGTLRHQQSPSTVINQRRNRNSNPQRQSVVAAQSFMRTNSPRVTARQAGTATPQLTYANCPYCGRQYDSLLLRVHLLLCNGHRLDANMAAQRTADRLERANQGAFDRTQIIISRTFERGEQASGQQSSQRNQRMQYSIRQPFMSQDRRLLAENIGTVDRVTNQLTQTSQGSRVPSRQLTGSQERNPNPLITERPQFSSSDENSLHQEQIGQRFLDESASLSTVLINEHELYPDRRSMFYMPPGTNLNTILNPTTSSETSQTDPINQNTRRPHVFRTQRSVSDGRTRPSSSYSQSNGERDGRFVVNTSNRPNISNNYQDLARIQANVALRRQRRINASQSSSSGIPLSEQSTSSGQTSSRLQANRPYHLLPRETPPSSNTSSLWRLMRRQRTPLRTQIGFDQIAQEVRQQDSSGIRLLPPNLRSRHNLNLDSANATGGNTTSSASNLQIPIRDISDNSLNEETLSNQWDYYFELDNLQSIYDGQNDEVGQSSADEEYDSYAESLPTTLGVDSPFIFSYQDRVRRAQRLRQQFARAYLLPTGAQQFYEQPGLDPGLRPLMDSETESISERPRTQAESYISLYRPSSLLTSRMNSIQSRLLHVLDSLIIDPIVFYSINPNASSEGHSGLSNNQIGGLESYPYSTAVLSEDPCAICYCEYEEGILLIKLKCNHIFHKDCVSRWLKMNALCPLCKRSQAN